MDKGIDQTLNYLPLSQIQTDSFGNGNQVIMSDFIGRFCDTQEISPLTLQSFSENFPIYLDQFRSDQLLGAMRLQPTTQESNKSSLMDPDSISRPSNRPQNKPNSRKRKSIPSPASSSLTASNSKISDQNCASLAPKRSKKDANKKTENKDESKDNTKLPEPPKDYIHVRARRGQATDSHSLAERARREKISERMKLLQDLVPGCNKITGKAVMLDEIINYVESLQTQVEFLSMKLATINPRIELDSNSILSTELTQCMYSEERYPSGCLAIDKNQFQLTSSMPTTSDGFVQAATLWENDLQSIVQMGFGDNQQQSIICSERTVEMKLEPER